MKREREEKKMQKFIETQKCKNLVGPWNCVSKHDVMCFVCDVRSEALTYTWFLSMGVWDEEEDCFDISLRTSAMWPVWRKLASLSTTNIWTLNERLNFGKTLQPVIYTRSAWPNNKILLVMMQFLCVRETSAFCFSHFVYFARSILRYMLEHVIRSSLSRVSYSILCGYYSMRLC